MKYDDMGNAPTSINVYQ